MEAAVIYNELIKTYHSNSYGASSYLIYNLSKLTCFCFPFSF